MANNTISRKKRGISTAIFNLLFGPAESQEQLKENVEIFMQNHILNIL